MLDDPKDLYGELKLGSARGRRDEPHRKSATRGKSGTRELSA